MKKVVILGGGVGGVECAIHLRKYHFDVELVSDRDFLYIYPHPYGYPRARQSWKMLVFH